jgi:predicted ATPase/class 3 adenylate cyclase
MKESLHAALGRLGLGRLLRAVGNRGATPSVAAPHAGAESFGLERRQLTVMFCDLVDSTRLLERFDEEDHWSIVERYFACCREHILRYRGEVQRYEGDGLLAYFGYPQADEHAAQSAVLAGLEIAAAVPRLKVEHGLELQTRIGIATGEVVVGKSVDEGKARENSAQGRAPNLAARLLKSAPPGAVAISDTTHALVWPLFEFQDLGTQNLKGFDTPARVWIVTRRREIESRSEAIHLSDKLTALVGREKEVTQLLRCWVETRNGKGQVALVSGEAGIGKSRLIRTLLERLVKERFVLLHYYGVQHFQHTSLYPLAKQLERAARIREDDAAQVKLEKLASLLGHEVGDVARFVPWFASLLSMPLNETSAASSLSPERRHQETLTALKQRILELGDREPVIVVFEDLHWIDDASLQFVDQLIAELQMRRIMLVLSYRPSFEPPFGARPNLSRIVLDRLDRDDRMKLVMELTGRKALPRAVLEHILEETDGIPLYVEEFTKSVLQSEMLEEQAGAYKLVGELAGMKLPHSLRDSLMARLDRLAPDQQVAQQCKEIAQTCAVIGRQFSYELLAAVSPHGAEALENALRQLEKADLVFRLRSLADRTYSFKHALLQEEAYQSILHRNLRRLHVRIAEVLERQFPAIVEIEPELLARHYTEGGLPLEAIPYWQLAAQRAAQRAAHHQAIAHLKASLRALERLPKDPLRDSLELKSQALLGLSLAANRGYAVPEVAEAYQRARTLCDGLDETAEESFSVLRSGLVTFYVVRADYDTANRLSEQFVQKAESVQRNRRPRGGAITNYHIDSYRCLGIARMFRGDLEASREALLRCVELYAESRSRNLTFLTPENPAVAALSVLPLTLWLLGCADEALRRKNEAVSLANELGDPFNIAFAHTWSAALHQWRREPERAAEHAGAAIEYSQKYGFDTWLPAGSMHLSIALGAQRRMSEAIALFDQVMPIIEASGAVCFTSYFYSGLAETYAIAGEFAQGLAQAARALEIATVYREQFFHAEVLRRRGALRLMQSANNAAAAEEDFKVAVDMARRQRARALELRTLVSLHRLHRDQGRGAESHAQLESAFSALTEGFDTVDVREAARLLTE